MDIHGWKPKPETEPETKPKPEPENRGRKTNTKPETRKTKTRGYPHRTRSAAISTQETLDRSLRDITGYDLPFGGKVMVFGGDFRQVLHVVLRGTRAQICDDTLLQSYIWDDIKIIRLKQIMRAQNDV